MIDSWAQITLKEFNHWWVEVNRTHHLHYETIGHETRWFIEDVGLNKIYLLSKVDTEVGSYYSKNESRIGS